MTIKAPSMSWPLRDSWAAERQPTYPDSWIPNCPSDFATSVEIDMLIFELRRLHDSGVARRHITAAIKKLRGDQFPFVPEVPEAKRLLEPLRRRRDDAHQLHRKAWSQHRNDHPVDDAAWEAELQRRAAIESEFAAAWAERMNLEEGKAEVAEAAV